MKSYLVKKVSNIDAYDSNIWDNVPKIKVDNFVWDENGYKPVVEAAVFYTDTHFHVHFKAFEQEITAKYRNANDPVCRDSCMEFFFKPDPETDDRYLNFEMNPIGTILIGLGKDRHERVNIFDSPKIFKIKTSVDRDKLSEYNGNYWTITYSIPFDFLEKYFGKLKFTSGKKLLANFYKCGDDSKCEHYGSWNIINLPKPDFHCPEFFGELVLG